MNHESKSNVLRKKKASSFHNIPLDSLLIFGSLVSFVYVRWSGFLFMYRNGLMRIVIGRKKTNYNVESATNSSYLAQRYENNEKKIKIPVPVE